MNEMTIFCAWCYLLEHKLLHYWIAVFCFILKAFNLVFWTTKSLSNRPSVFALFFMFDWTGAAHDRMIQVSRTSISQNKTKKKELYTHSVLGTKTFSWILKDAFCFKATFPVIPNFYVSIILTTWGLVHFRCFLYTCGNVSIWRPVTTKRKVVFTV